MRPALLALALVLAACSCNGGDGDPDAPPPQIDAEIDAPQAVCNGTVQFTGGLLDFDSTTALFMGVPGAVVRLRGMPDCTSTTAPNGRYDLQVPDMDAIADVDAPIPYIDAILIAERETLGGTVLVNLRLPTTSRAASFYQAQGLTFTAGRAHVLVFVAGDRVALSLDAQHDAVQAASDDDGDGVYVWAAGDTGRYVLFPNVDPGQPTAQLSGDPAGPLTIPLQADLFTLPVEGIVLGS